MGKATRIKRETAREKIAAQRAAARKAEMRNRIFITGGSILGVLVILAAFLIFKAFSGSSGSSAPSSATGTALPASVIKDLTTVPAATLESVGSGAAYPKSVSPVSAPAADLRRASPRCSTSAPSTARTARPSGGRWRWR